MKNVSLTLTGSGTVGEIQPGWSVQEDATPVAIGDSSGGVGSIDLSVAQGEDSEFVIDNLSTFSHPTLGNISGKVTAATSAGASEATDTNLSIQLTTPLSDLAVERSASVVSGMYDDILFAGYGDFAGVSNANSHAVYHLNDDISYIYEEGGVIKINRVTPLGVSTLITTTIPATTPTIKGFIVDYFDAYFVALMVSGVPKIYKLNTAGVTQYSVGTLGASAGQLAAFPATMKAALAYDDNYFYVADYANNRVQRYTTSAGTYNSGFSITAPMAVGGGGNGRLLVMSGTFLLSNIFVASANQFLWGVQYSGLTGYTPIGLRYTFRTSSEATILVTKSGNGLMGKLDITYTTGLATVNRDVSDWTNIPVTVYAGTFGPWSHSSTGLPEYGNSFTTLLIDSSVTGHETANYITDGTTLRGLIGYYCALCGVDYINYAASIDPIIIAIPWTDIVWNKLKELFSAYGVEGAIVNNVMTIRDIGATTLDPENVIAGSARLTLDSKATARSLNVTNYNTSITTPLGPTAMGLVAGLAYSAALTGKVFSVNTGATTVETVITDAYLNKILTPAPGGFFSGYSVQDSTGLDVTSLWLTAAGNRVEVAIGSQPNEIIITLSGPTTDFPGAVGPYSLASDGLTRTPRFNIYGQGVFTTPTVINLPTGADETKTPNENAKDIKNIFVNNIERLYDRANWFIVGAAGPQMTLKCQVPTDYFSQFGQVAGVLVPFKESIYRIISANVNGAITELTATHYVTTGAADAILSGKTTGQFDTFWSGNDTEDFKIKPLRPIV